MLRSFARMLPELLRHSDRKDVLDGIRDELKEAHRPRAVQRDDATAQEDACRNAAATAATAAAAASAPRRSSSLWGSELGSLGEAMREPELGRELFFGADDNEDEALLDGAGF